MKEDKNKAVKAAGIYIAVVLGAGFASGQEIISYFIRFGTVGFLGLAIAAFLFGFIGYAVFSICITAKIDSYKDFMDIIAGKRLGSFMEVILTLFMFILFATMLAAAGATVKEAFFMPFVTGVFLTLLLCFIAFLFGMEGILKINAFLAPFMIFGSIFTALFVLITESVAVFGSISGIALIRENFVVSAVTYVSYNVITAITVLSAMRKDVVNKRNSAVAGFTAGLLLLALGLSVGLPMYLNFDAVSSVEIPLLVLVQKHGNFIEYFYLLVMLAAIFSTAATNGFAVVNWLRTKTGLNPFFVQIIVCTAGGMLSFAGFKNFVGTVYPIFALAGFLEVLLIIKCFLGSLRKSNMNKL